MYDPLNPYGYQEEEEKGVGGHVLDLLAYFDRPRNAIAAGIKGLGAGDPLGGFYRGLTGQEDVSFGDLVGIERGRPDDDWATWLAKSGSRFVLDAALDPLNVLFAPAKAAGIYGRAAKAMGVPEGATAIGQAWKHLPDTIPLGRLGEIPLQHDNIANKIFESGIGKRFWNRAPDTPEYRHLNELEDMVRRESQQVPARMAAQEANVGMTEALKGTKFTPKDVTSRVEGIGPYDEAAQIGEKYIEPVKQLNEQTFDTRNLEMMDLGLDPHLKTNEEFVRLVPRKLRSHEIPEGGERVWLPGDDMRVVGKEPHWKMPHKGSGLQRTIADVPVETKAFTQPHAEIASWRRAQDPDIGQLGMAPDIETAVGKLKDPRTKVVRTPDGKYLLKDGRDANGSWSEIFEELGVDPHRAIGMPEGRGVGGGIEVFPTRASFESASSVMPKGAFNPNPAEAFGSNIDWMNKQTDFLRIFKGLRENGDILHYGGPDTLMKGYTPVTIPGMDTFQIRSGMVNWLANKAKSMYDPRTPGAWDEELMRKALDTKAGRGLKFATDHAKRYMLLDPSWGFANAVSGVQQEAQGGVGLLDLLPRNIDAAKLLWRNYRGKGGDVVEGIGNKDLLIDLAKRGAQGAEGLYGASIGREHGVITKQLVDKLLGEKAGDIAQKGMQKFGGAVDKFFKAGSTLEDQGKLVVVLDRLKKDYPNFASLSDAEKAAALDDVAGAAKKVMFDYSNLTPYEKSLQQIFPFYNWTRNITAATGKMALNSPQTLANYGRGLDTVFEPMDPKDKAIADDWVRQSGPIYGAMGWRPPKDEEGRNMMLLLARYLPQGQLEQFIHKPKDTALGMVNPYIKVLPEVLGNYNTYKGRPIDPLVGFPGMFLNPLVGATHDLGRSKLLGQDVPAGMEYLHSFLPGGRQLRQLDTWGRGLGLWEDPNKGPIEPGDAFAWSVTGGKAYPFDRDRALINRQREEKAQAANIKSRLRFANRKGDMSQYEYYMRLLEEDVMRREKRRRDMWGPDAV